MRKSTKSETETKTVAPKKATKATTEKKAVAKKTATKKAGSATTAKASVASCGGFTKVVVKFDAGWGNNLYIRGNGAGLNWQKGVLMQCVDAEEWTWEHKIAKGEVDFKILLNDEVWSNGEDYKIAAGCTITVHPCFCE